MYHLHAWKLKPEARFDRFSRSFRATYETIHKQLKASKKRYLEHRYNENRTFRVCKYKKPRHECCSINSPNILLNHSIKQSTLPIHVSNYHKTLITAISTSLEVWPKYYRAKWTASNEMPVDETLRHPAAMARTIPGILPPSNHPYPILLNNLSASHLANPSRKRVVVSADV